jgi:hypothetical protein
MLAWFQEGFLPIDLAACGIAKTLSTHPPDAFYRPLRELFRLVRAGINYEPVSDAALAQGAPGAGWCEVPLTALVADAPPPALVPALEQLRQLALQMAAEAGELLRARMGSSALRLGPAAAPWLPRCCPVAAALLV